MSCDKCGSTTHRDDAMNVRCNSCEHLMHRCICDKISLSLSYYPTRLELRLIHAYNKENNRPTWVVHTPPESRIGGFSAEFIEFLGASHTHVVLKQASGDLFTVPLTEVTISVQF